MQWRHKHLLDVDQLSKEEIIHIFGLAKNFQEINQRPVKKVPTLKGKSIILFFAEPSTRTKTSFDIAGKRLSADTFSLAKTSSSLTKGESLKDTVLTLEAMRPDCIVIRHWQSGAAQFVSSQIDCSVINAGDGWHAHPTQALLDGFVLYSLWQTLEQKKILIVGDIAHSRVARSDIKLFSILGAKVRLCAPRTLLPFDISAWPVEVFHDLKQACVGVDAIICLRLQLERQEKGLLPDLREYSQRYCVTFEHLNLAQKNVKIMHPGPMNRGIEIDSSIADCKDSLVLDQVQAGVAVRMAILYLFILGTN
ncbi:MAG: aspartate carbamoyltransferase catalytic subunit [Desulfonauticus sp.]|nr:aspartate carbamoyltransferase catalytic subunit [Desulfonauticus sp.]